MPKLPQVSGENVIRLLATLGYERVRQRGSHVRLRKITPLGEHNMTVVVHQVTAKGTLNDILSEVSLWNGVTKEELIEKLK